MVDRRWLCEGRWSRPERRPPCGRSEKAVLALSAQPIAVAADREHVDVVQKAVVMAGRHDRITDTATHSGDAAVRRDEDCAHFITAADALEENVRRDQWELDVNGPHNSVETHD